MSKDLQTKYDTDEGFREQVAKNMQRRKVLQQTWMQYDASDKQMIPANILRKMPNRNIYLYFGYRQPTENKYASKVAMNFLSEFKPHPSQPYSFVFMNDLSRDNYVLWNFREIFGLLALQELSQLHEFIVYKPSFYQKAMEWMIFGTIPKFLKSKTVFISSCQKLCEHLSLPLSELLDQIPPQYYKTEFPHLYAQATSTLQTECLPEQPETAIAKSIKHMVSKPNHEVNNLQDYEMNEIGIPIVLRMLIFYFETNPELLKEEGIFRKSVSVDDEAETIKLIIERNYDYLLEVKNPHIISNLIKRFFASLKQPVIPYSQFDMLMDDAKVQDKTAHLKRIISMLPELNRRVLISLINFLSQNVVGQNEQNKMDSNNLAICFAPCLLRSRDMSGLLKSASKSPTYTKIMLQKTSEVFGDTEVQTELYRSSYNQTQTMFYQGLDIGLEETMRTLESLQKEKTPRSSVHGQKEQLEMNLESNPLAASPLLISISKSSGSESQQATLQPQQTTLQPQQATLQPQQTTLQPQQATLQPQQTNLSKQANIQMQNILEQAKNKSTPPNPRSYHQSETPSDLAVKSHPEDHSSQDPSQ